MIWLSVDPGDNTGWALWDGNKLADAGQMDRQDFIDSLYDHCGPVKVMDDHPWQPIELVVCEEWQLYPWKARQLAWDKCRTARAIGAIELICRLSNITLVLQPAKIKEQAQAGGAKELFLRPFHENRHSNDAIMHGFWHIQRSRVLSLNSAKA